MTVAEWVTTRSSQPPVALLNRVLDALGPDGAKPASATADTCISSATRELQRLLAARRFHRDGALDLLAVDALVTYAFEHASMSPGCDVGRLSADAIARLGALIRAA